MRRHHCCHEESLSLVPTVTNRPACSITIIVRNSGVRVRIALYVGLTTVRRFLKSLDTGQDPDLASLLSGTGPGFKAENRHGEALLWHWFPSLHARYRHGGSLLCEDSGCSWRNEPATSNGWVAAGRRADNRHGTSLCWRSRCPYL